MTIIVKLLLVSLSFIVLAVVMTRSLLRAAVGLAVASAVLSIIMFNLGANIAALYELSVCVGLIPVIFITVISLTKPLKRDDVKAEVKEKTHRFWPLPVIFIAAAILLLSHHIGFDVKAAPKETEQDVKKIVWNVRQADLVGQITVLIAGALGILVLFKEMKSK